MTELRNALICGFLLIACIIGLQASYLVLQAGMTLRRVESELRETNRQAQASLLYAQAVLSSVRGTTEAVRRSAVHQVGYGEAMLRRSSQAMARLELLIDHSDDRLERITRAAEQTSEQAGEMTEQIKSLATTLQDDLHGLAAASTALVEVSRGTVEDLDQRLSDERLDRIADGLAVSSENAAKATANAAEATGYLRDLLAPGKKNLWRWLPGLLVPRPTFEVR